MRTIKSRADVRDLTACKEIVFYAKKYLFLMHIYALTDSLPCDHTIIRLTIRPVFQAFVLLGNSYVPHNDSEILWEVLKRLADQTRGNLWISEVKTFFLVSTSKPAIYKLM